MYGTIVRTASMLAALLAFAAPASAGGFATIHLDHPPGDVDAGVPWRLGFLVLQHDVTPVNVEHAYLTARHRETGASLRADARQEGPTGHYVVEVTFPQAGAWKWRITPEPFAATSFETLQVQGRPQTSAGVPNQAVAGGRGHPADIQTGTCQRLGGIAYPLGEVIPGGTTEKGTPVVAAAPANSTGSLPVAISTTTVPATLADLMAAPHAINLAKSAQDMATSVACGDLGGRLREGELVVGLPPQNASGDVGVAVLRADGDQTTVTLYLLVASDGTGGAAPEANSGAPVAVEIVEGGDSWQFRPSQLAITVGTTVMWTNRTGVAHTVTGDDLVFEDSGPLAPGQAFRQIFTVPGTYAYRCGPHPFMTGTIVVT